MNKTFLLIPIFFLCASIALGIVSLVKDELVTDYRTINNRESNIHIGAIQYENFDIKYKFKDEIVHQNRAGDLNDYKTPGLIMFVMTIVALVLTFLSLLVVWYMYRQEIYDLMKYRMALYCAWISSILYIIANALYHHYVHSKFEADYGYDYGSMLNLGAGVASAISSICIWIYHEKKLRNARKHMVYNVPVEVRPPVSVAVVSRSIENVSEISELDLERSNLEGGGENRRNTLSVNAHEVEETPIRVENVPHNDVGFHFEQPPPEENNYRYNQN